jgi:hypothetical protein
MTLTQKPFVDTATKSTVPSAHAEDRVERRQVMVLFSDWWAYWHPSAVGFRLLIAAVFSLDSGRWRSS